MFPLRYAAVSQGWSPSIASAYFDHQRGRYAEVQDQVDEPDDGSPI